MYVCMYIHRDKESVMVFRDVEVEIQSLKSTILKFKDLPPLPCCQVVGLVVYLLADPVSNQLKPRASTLCIPL